MRQWRLQALCIVSESSTLLRLGCLLHSPSSNPHCKNLWWRKLRLDVSVGDQCLGAGWFAVSARPMSSSWWPLQWVVQNTRVVLSFKVVIIVIISKSCECVIGGPGADLEQGLSRGPPGGVRLSFLSSSLLVLSLLRLFLRQKSHDLVRHV